MIRPGALLMSVLMAAVAVGTYFGLGYAPPGIVPGVGAKPAEQEDARGGETPVAGVGTAVTQGTVEPLAQPVEPAADAAPEMTASTEPAATENPAAAEAPAASETPKTAEAAAAPSPAPAGTGASSYASSEEVERALADEPPPEEDVVKPQAAAPTPAPASKPKAGPPKASTPAKTAAAPAPQAAPSTSEPSESASKPAATRSADADAIKPWWPDPAKMPENQLKLMYAGQVQNELAIALLFSAPVDLDSLKQNTQVKTAAGDPVGSGQWELGKNPKLAIFRGVKPGRYTLVLSPTITGAKGFMLGTTLQGPVYVKAP